MTGKLYSQLEHLTAEQAISYLCFLIDVKTDAAIDVLIDYANQGVLDFYCEFDDTNGSFLLIDLKKISLSYLNTEEFTQIEPIGRQRHVKGLSLIQKDNEVQAHVSIQSIHGGISFYGDIFHDPFTPTKSEDWVTTGFFFLGQPGYPEKTDRDVARYGFQLKTKVDFLRMDIEALAAKINAEPDYQTLQVENERLQQGLGTLKEEVERLQTENTKLKAELERSQVGSKDGTMLPRHESENLRVAGWAINEFYHPDTFDINDSKTYPKQSYMIAEIMRVHGVTEPTARAIDRVVTPFSRNKSKK